MSLNTRALRWERFFQDHACLAAGMSRDSTQVGAALVDLRTRTVVATGFNGPPRGVEDLPERLERPGKYLWASHAEANVIAHCASLGIRTEGRVLYVTHQPCAACARTIIQAGIGAVHFGRGTTSMPGVEFEVARTMIREASVDLRPWEAR